MLISLCIIVLYGRYSTYSTILFLLLLLLLFFILMLLVMLSSYCRSLPRRRLHHPVRCSHSHDCCPKLPQRSPENNYISQIHISIDFILTKNNSKKLPRIPPSSESWSARTSSWVPGRFASATAASSPGCHF